MRATIIVLALVACVACEEENEESTEQGRVLVSLSYSDGPFSGIELIGADDENLGTREGVETWGAGDDYAPGTEYETNWSTSWSFSTIEITEIDLVRLNLDDGSVYDIRSTSLEWESSGPWTQTIDPQNLVYYREMYSTQFNTRSNPINFEED